MAFYGNIIASAGKKLRQKFLLAKEVNILGIRGFFFAAALADLFCFIFELGTDVRAIEMCVSFRFICTNEFFLCSL